MMIYDVVILDDFVYGQTEVFPSPTLFATLGLADVIELVAEITETTAAKMSFLGYHSNDGQSWVANPSAWSTNTLTTGVVNVFTMYEGTAATAPIARFWKVSAAFQNAGNSSRVRLRARGRVRGVRP